MEHSLPKAYSQHGSVFHKRYFINALKLIYNNEIIKVNGLGSLGRCTIKEQPENNRICINMAYASPVKRGYAEVIEDILPIYNIETEVKTQKKIKRVYLPLTGDEIAYSQNDGNVSFVVPKLEGHIIVVLEF